MPVSTDIAASYRRPRAVVRAHLARGESEPRALAFLMGGCALMFVARLPALSRQAHLEQVELNPLLGGTLMAVLFIAPLLFYALAALTQIGAKLIRKPISGYAARIALFWALLASSPLILLSGLVAGFIGEGPALQLVGAIWFGVFAWFWIAGLRAGAEEAAA